MHTSAPEALATACMFALQSLALTSADASASALDVPACRRRWLSGFWLAAPRGCRWGGLSPFEASPRFGRRGMAQAIGGVPRD